MEITNHPTAYAIVIVVATMLATSIIQWTFLITLKRKYRSQWHHAGNPTIWSDQSIISAWSTVRYLQNRMYLTSGDEAGVVFCNKFRGTMVIGYWITIVVFVAGVIVGVFNGWPPSWNW